MSDIKLRCQFCDRFIPLEPVQTTITRVRCSDRKCKKWNNIKVCFSDATDAQLKYKFEENKDE